MIDVLTFDDLWRACGGGVGVAAICGVEPVTARNWKNRSRAIPTEHWPKLIASPEGQKIGLCADILLAMHTGCSLPVPTLPDSAPAAPRDRQPENPPPEHHPGAKMEAAE